MAEDLLSKSDEWMRLKTHFEEVGKTLNMREMFQTDQARFNKHWLAFGNLHVLNYCEIAVSQRFLVWILDKVFNFVPAFLWRHLKAL